MVSQHALQVVSQHALQQGGVLSQHALQVVSQHALQQVSKGGSALGGACSQGVCSWGCVETPQKQMATVANGTHPTGMHSCFIIFLKQIRFKLLFHLQKRALLVIFKKTYVKHKQLLQF